MPLQRPIPILVVDDEADLRLLLMEALEDMGYAPEGAEGGDQALARIRERHFPLICTDLNMPGGLTGLELIKAIHEVDPKALTILMTGYATTESAIQALKHGAYDFIQKPFKLAEFEASIKRALDHYGLLRQNEDYQHNLERMVEERTREILGLKDEIENLFEGFVNASITAIEARDPSTSGHSSRVATLTVGLAEAVNRTEGSGYGDLFYDDRQLREIRYASLLHDFGKVGVREHLLVKAKKIEGERLELIFQRLHQRAVQRVMGEMERAWRNGETFTEGRVAYLQEQVVLETQRLVALLMRANEPTVLPQDVSEGLVDVQPLTYKHWSGEERTLLTEADFEMLQIRKGSLSHDERRAVESHVTHSYKFLVQIPWTEELRKVPEIAYAHHERLNGKGYPRGLMADEIPLPSKMMAISDVFDALAAHDRPYKVAVSVERSLQILEEEAKSGLLDANLLRLFIDARVFQLTNLGKAAS
ncbi:MAG TPA: HD domain-containing phosphohydrolase [Holophagaceae bacterium]|nr:HD domain-containing phosphohydrolase [Holophagaceae bacterium]HJW33205.1 HD domain-containing phosphohydrolase [Holophagaceae bacterium]